MKLLDRISIKERIAFFTVMGISALILFFMVNIWFLNRKTKANGQMMLSCSIVSSVSNITGTGYTYITDMYMNGEEIYMSINNYDRQISSLYNYVQVAVDSIRDYNFVRNDSLILDNLIQISTETDKYYNLFKDLVLSYKEKGTLSVNLVKNWDITGDQIVEQIKETEDVDLMAEVIKLRKLEKEYLVNAAGELLTEQKEVLAYIKEFVAFTYPGKVYSIDKLTKEYLHIAREIETINKRIGVGNTLGIQQDLNNSAQELKVLTHDFKRAILETNRIMGLKLFRNLIFLYLVIILALASLFMIMGASFVKPITQVVDFLKSINAGVFPRKFAVKRTGDIFDLQLEVNKLPDMLRAKMEFTDALSKSKIDKPFELLSKQDSFGKVLNELYNNQIKAQKEHNARLKENQTRRYINEGLAKFSDIMRRNDNDIDKLATLYIQELVKYLDAVQGGIFFTTTDEDNQSFLELKGAYAYNRKKYMDKRIKFGQGLVGTCASESKPIVPLHIPEDYVQITSGLGDAPPNKLILYPIMAEETLQGVVEIAGFQDIEGDKLEFLKQVSESLATALRGIKVNVQTAELLKKSQQQAAEMSEQEEEMRQSMEELQATQEEAARREEELNNFVKSVNTSIPLLTVTPEGIITSANRLFAGIFDNEDRSLYENKAFAEVLLTGEDPEHINEHWNNILKGEIGEEIITNAIQGRAGEIYLHLQYRVNKDFDGEAIKIVVFVQDITEYRLKEFRMETVEKENLKNRGELDFINGLFNTSLVKAEFEPDGKLISANKLFYRNTGLEEEKIAAQKYTEFLNKAEIDRFNTLWDTMLSKKNHVSSLVMRTKPSGEVVWLSANFTPVVDNGRVTKIVLLANNISDNIKRLTQ